MSIPGVTLSQLEMQIIASALCTAGVLTVTNSNNIANLMPFNLVLCLNPNNVITGAPVNYTITVNGVAVPLLNRVALPISTDHLMPRKRYAGYYIIPTSGDPYVILVNTPCDLAYAVSSASVAKEADTETTGD